MSIKFNVQMLTDMTSARALPGDIYPDTVYGLVNEDETVSVQDPTVESTCQNLVCTDRNSFVLDETDELTTHTCCVSQPSSSDEVCLFNYMSNECANANGLFTNEPTISMSGLEVELQYSGRPPLESGDYYEFDISGVCLYAMDYPPSEVTLEYYKHSDPPVLESTRTFILNNLNPDNALVFDSKYQSKYSKPKIYNLIFPMKDVTKVVIRFERGIPGRKIKLGKIQYGVNFAANSEKVIDAKLVEGYEPYSTNLSAKELSVSVIDKAGVFDPVSSESLYSYVRKGQPVIVNIEGTPIYYPRIFFIKDVAWRDEVAKFTFTDFVGLDMDAKSFGFNLGINMYKSGIADILKRTNAGNYYTTSNIYPNIYGKYLTGVLDADKSYKQVLSEMVIASGGYIDERDDYLNISEIPIYHNTGNGKITREDKISTEVFADKAYDASELDYKYLASSSTVTYSKQLDFGNKSSLDVVLDKPVLTVGARSSFIQSVDIIAPYKVRITTYDIMSVADVMFEYSSPEYADVSSYMGKQNRLANIVSHGFCIPPYNNFVIDTMLSNNLCYFSLLYNGRIKLKYINEGNIENDADRKALGLIERTFIQSSSYGEDKFYPAMLVKRNIDLLSYEEDSEFLANLDKTYTEAEVDAMIAPLG